MHETVKGFIIAPLFTALAFLQLSSLHLQGSCGDNGATLASRFKVRCHRDLPEMKKF